MDSTHLISPDTGAFVGAAPRKPQCLRGRSLIRLEGSLVNTISTLWVGLDSVVKQWLISNPGTVVLPRTLVNRVEATTGEKLSSDEHGEHRFSGEEVVFLRAQARAAGSSTSLTTSPPPLASVSPVLRQFPVEALDR